MSDLASKTDFDSIAAEHDSVLVAVKWPLPHVAHVKLADGRILVVDHDYNTGRVLRVYGPEAYAGVDLAQCRTASVAAKWDVNTGWATELVAA